nr:MAG TPA: Head fiber protein triple repeating helix-turn-helix, VIRAL.52A [Caudoviricetes sp.]
MSEYNAKNYTEQGGDVTHIHGRLVIEDDGEISGLPQATGFTPGIIKADEISRDVHYTVEVMINSETGKLYVPEYPFAAHQANSTATTVAALKDDFNALLAKLVDGGLMAPDDKKTER